MRMTIAGAPPAKLASKPAALRSQCPRGAATGKPRLGLITVLVFVISVIFAACPAAAWASTVEWAVHVASEPSSFNAADAVACAGPEHKCDRYQLLIQNAGDAPSSGPITVTDRLPTGITTEQVNQVNEQSGAFSSGARWNCTSTNGAPVLTCTAPEVNGKIESIPTGGYAPYLDVLVTAPTAEMSGTLHNAVTVQGGGAPAVTSTVTQTEIAKPLAFEVNEFAFEPQLAGGEPSLQAGSHPWELTTDIASTVGYTPPHGTSVAETPFAPVRNMRSLVVELPAGVIGNPLATAHCEEVQLRLHECPAASEAGVLALLDGKATNGEFAYTGEAGETVSPVFNMVPDAGYPAEFGFTFNKTVPVLLYADVVHTGTGYRLRITAPGVPSTLETIGSALTFFGDPGELNGSGSHTAFLSNPADCTAEAEHLSAGAEGTAKDLSSRLELEPWGEQEHVVTSEATAYPSLTGCGALPFDPTVSAATSPPGTDPTTQQGSTQADEPSAYSVGLKVPQTSGFGEPATPPVRDVTVELPEGVSVDPSAATGLVGCPATGPHGINIGSDETGVHGQDLGDPEATELGEGHEGGDGSAYDDGFYHTAPGRCPAASVLGNVEVCTPLLTNPPSPSSEGKVGTAACEQNPGIAPLRGDIYLAEPKCGGAGQPACKESPNQSEDSAENGELFSGYIEVAGDGVIVKLPGTIAADPATGQLTGTFRENPQFPLSLIRLHFKGGPKAPVANPQTCGSFTSVSTVTSWAGQSVSALSQPFAITGCAASMPFSPSLSAATGSRAAGGDTSFVLSFTRQDGEQDFSGLSETMPPGLVGAITGIPLCPEAAAQAGTCATVAPQSEIGTTSVLAGPGPEPYSQTGGHVYLTGPYGGGPFGLSIVVPAQAGPFNLGNEVIRAAIHINPATAQVTVTTGAIPLSKDGVPFRLRSITTEVNHAGFLRNPTSCALQSVSATITAAQGASANVSAPLQATGCTGLPFAPTLTETTKANASKANGASLSVTVTQKPGEANIHKVDLQLPVSLPSRLTTLQKACTEAQFNANPAGCPDGSDIGTATAHTPLLNVPLTGPAYLVSHGGAAFPDVEFVLQGENVTIVLDGKTDIKKGITYSNFETVPDAPDSSFTANFPEGPHSVLTAYGSLCTPTETITVKKRITRRIHGHNRHITIKTKKTIPKPLVSPTTIVGQNGATIKQTTKIAVTGCPKSKPAAQPKPAPKNKKAARTTAASA